MDIAARYELLEKIGSGSFATVYRARDKELGREVAVKQIHQQYLDDPKLLDRYWQEAQLLASLQHPNIVTMFDVERSRGWLIMELMHGNLSERMSGRQMDLRSLRTTLAHGLRALKYLHARGIVHGDIKPSNLMIDARRRVKLGDFGLARRASDEEGSLLKGTTKYMAPETVSEEFGEVGPASDLYSLGFSAYELMCGPNFESLFPGLSAFGRNKQIAWMMWHAAADRRLPDIHRVLEGVPDDLASVIQKLCDKDQAQRYQLADDALNDLHVDTKTTPVEETTEIDPEQPPQENADRKKRILAIAAFSFSAVLSLVIALLPTGGGARDGNGSDMTYGIVSKVYLEENRIKLNGLDTPGAYEIEIAQRSEIILHNEKKYIVLRDLLPGDRIAIKGSISEPIVRITVYRPVSDRGRVKSIDLNASTIVIAVLEGNHRDDLTLTVPKRAKILLDNRSIALRDVKVGDHVDVSHLAAMGTAKGRVVDTLQVRRVERTKNRKTHEE